MEDVISTEEIEEPSVRAIAKYVRVSPFKVRPVIDLIKGKPAEEAISILQFSRKGVAEHILKVLNSAVANAQDNDRLRAKPEDLVVSEAYINEGPTLKRIRFRAMGRVAGIKKRTSHITIVLSRNEEA